jgi:hypothetical protein
MKVTPFAEVNGLFHTYDIFYTRRPKKSVYPTSKICDNPR